MKKKGLQEKEARKREVKEEGRGVISFCLGRGGKGGMQER